MRKWNLLSGGWGRIHSWDAKTVCNDQVPYHGIEDMGLVIKKKIVRTYSKPPGSHTHIIVLVSTNPHGYLLWLGQHLEIGRKDALSKSVLCNSIPTDDLPLSKIHLF